MSGVTVSQRRPLQAILVGLGIFGSVVTWGRTVADGSFQLLEEALAGEHTFPGSESRLLASFTGIGPLDHLLRTLVVFFWETVDGSHPKNSAAGIYFSGQLFPIIIAIYLDSQRRGNNPSLIRPSLWFLSFSAAAIGCVGAAWALLYIASSPTVSRTITLDALQGQSLVSSPRAAGLLLPATIVAFAMMVVLMALPSPTVVSPEFQQWAIVVWNAFPLLLLAIVRIGEPLLNIAFPADVRQASRDKQAQVHLGVVRWLGLGAIFGGAVIHLAVAAISLSAALFPAIFAEGYAEALHPMSLAVPPIAIEQGKTVGDGIWGFMVWDQVAGFAIVQIIFLLQLQNAQRLATPTQQGELVEFSWIKAGALAFVLSFLIGPGSTIMALSWWRDEILYSAPANSAQPRKNGRAK